MYRFFSFGTLILQQMLLNLFFITALYNQLVTEIVGKYNIY